MTGDIESVKAAIKGMGGFQSQKPVSPVKSNCAFSKKRDTKNRCSKTVAGRSYDIKLRLFGLH